MDTARTLKLELFLIYAAHCGCKYHFGVVYKLPLLRLNRLLVMMNNSFGFETGTLQFKG
jgi:hypothetical protein